MEEVNIKVSLHTVAQKVLESIPSIKHKPKDCSQQVVSNKK